MKKAKKKKDSSHDPDKVAQEFWKDIYKKLNERIFKHAKQGDGSAKEKKHYLDYIREKEKHFNKPVGNIEELLLSYKYLVKPELNFHNIHECLSELNIDANKIQLIIFTLKPTPIEKSLIPNDNELSHAIDQSLDNACKDFNKRIKQLSPLVKRLQNLIDEGDSFKKFIPIHLTVLAIQRDIDICKAIVRHKRETDKKYLGIFLIDKDLKKSPQKHKFWNYVVSEGIKILNPYCHTDNCQKNCKITHQIAYRKVAELLKILYPSIWTESIKTIVSRIKQKDYRQISA